MICSSARMAHERHATSSSFALSAEVNSLLCEGGELLDHILANKDGRYTEKDATVIVRQMLECAAECHLHGLVYRDMKPENFLFKSTKYESALKAINFGLSDFIKLGKKIQDIVGSACYVAPEVLNVNLGLSRMCGA